MPFQILGVMKVVTRVGQLLWRQTGRPEKRNSVQVLKTKKEILEKVNQ